MIFLVMSFFSRLKKKERSKTYIIRALHGIETKEVSNLELGTAFVLVNKVTGIKIKELTRDFTRYSDLFTFYFDSTYDIVTIFDARLEQAVRATLASDSYNVVVRDYVA